MNEWDSYWRSRSMKRRFMELMRKIYFAPVFTRLVKKHSRGRVLETGCGSGKYLAYFDDAYGIDKSKESVKLAKKYCKNVAYGNIFHIPFAEDFFDLTFNQGVMEHFTDKEWDKALEEFKRVAKKTLIIVPATTSMFRIYNPFKEEGYDRFFTKKELENKMKKHFKKVKVRYMPQSLFLSIYAYGEK